jgi:CheY-like chemotaxis protein
MSSGDSTRTPRVLVVDDDAAFRDMIRETLSADGFRVQTAGSAQAAIVALADSDFDVVVTDLMLEPLGTPQSSIDLIEHLKRHKPAVSIIVLSGFASSFKNQLAELRVPVLEKGVNTTEQLELLISRMTTQQLRHIEPTVISFRVEDMRRILVEELERLIAFKESTIILPGDLRINLPKPLLGFRGEIERKLRKCPYEKNIFLMMRFRSHTREIADYITDTLKLHSFRGVRADDEGWNLTGNVYNPVAVLHCCKFGIALFDDLADQQSYSANIDV